MTDLNPDEIQEVVREEVLALWSDLGRARERAVNGMWSMECDWVVERIMNLSRLVEVPITTYEIDPSVIPLFEELHSTEKKTVRYRSGVSNNVS